MPFKTLGTVLLGVHRYPSLHCQVLKALTFQRYTARSHGVHQSSFHFATAACRHELNHEITAPVRSRWRPPWGWRSSTAHCQAAESICNTQPPSIFQNIDRAAGRGMPVKITSLGKRRTEPHLLTSVSYTPWTPPICRNQTAALEPPHTQQSCYRNPAGSGQHDTTVQCESGKMIALGARRKLKWDSRIATPKSCCMYASDCPMQALQQACHPEQGFLFTL